MIMSAEQKGAVKILGSFYLELEEFGDFLKLLKGKFSSIDYYKRFQFSIDRPSSLPLEHVTEFCLKARAIRISLFSFKRSFNENDLPDDLREIFVAISVSIVQKGLTMKSGVACIGGLGVKQRKVTDVLIKWDEMKYPHQVIYSQEVFNAITGYFPLIKLIEALSSNLERAVF